MKFTILTGALSWLLFILLSPVTIPILTTLWLGRFLALSLGKIQKFKNNGVGIEESVTSLDSLFTVDAFSKKKHGANAFVLLLDGPINVNKLQEKAEQVMKIKGYDRLHSLRAVKWMGYFFWTSASSNPAVSLKSSFDIKDHFLIEANEICGDVELDKYLAKYMKRPFLKDQPRWDTLYIPNFKQDKNHNDSQVTPVFVLRFHHITGDGVSYFNFINEITEISPRKQIREGTPEAINHKQVPTKQQTAPFGSKIIGSIQNLYWTPLLIMHQAQEFTFHKDFLTRKKVSQDWTLLRTVVDFKDIKTIRKRHFEQNPLGYMATQNWIAAGTLREHFRREFLGALGPHTPAARFVFALPWVAPTKKSNISKFRNEFTYGIFKMPLNEPSRLHRKIAINEDCRINFKFRLPQVYRNIIPLYGLLPVVIANAIIGYNVGAATLLSNVVGPQTSTHLGGRKVVNIWGIAGVQWPHGGMTNVFTSYNGQMSCTCLFNNDLIPSRDTAALAKDLKDEFQSIKKLKTNSFLG